MEFVLDPALIAPEVSNRIVAPMIQHIAETHGEAALQETLAAAGLPDAYLRDLEGWVSYGYVEGLIAALHRWLYGDATLPPRDHPFWQEWRSMGRMTFRRDVTRRAQLLLRWAGSPRALFQRFPELARRGNAIMEVQIVAHEPGRVTIRCANPPTHPETPGGCWNRIGVFEAVPQVWGLPPASVRSLACLHDPEDPADHCLYEISYAQRNHRPALLFAAGSLAGGLVGQAMAGSAWGLLAGAAVVGLALSGWSWRRALAERDEVIGELDDLMISADARYQALWTEQRALRRALLANRKIAGFLPETLVEQIMEAPELELELGGRRTIGAVLFADIVGFTPRCERHAPEQVVQDLNTYFGYTDPLIDAHGGIIDKRMGDGIMAVFVERDGARDFRYRSLRCGLEILAGLERCNRALRAAGSEPVQIRIGVAAGPLVLGNIGSEIKLEYTVIGDPVNLSARLEGAAGHGALLTQAALLPWIEHEVASVEARQIQVKGKAAAIEVVELSGLRGEARPG